MKLFAFYLPKQLLLENKVNYFADCFCNSGGEREKSQASLYEIKDSKKQENLYTHFKRRLICYILII